jgi:hypothetical protein
MQREFRTSFDSVEDFQGSYIVPQNHMNSCSHEISSFSRTSGKAHKAWVYASNPIIQGQNTNHRAYPTIQFCKSEFGGFKTPCLVDFWVWLDFNPNPGDWLSLATLARSTSDSFWDAVLININDHGIVHLMHVPAVGLKEWDFQDNSNPIPLKQWVRISAIIDFDPEHGHADVYMNGIKVSSAQVRSGHGKLEQAHFGLYAPPWINSGVIYNDDLLIKELF